MSTTVEQIKDRLNIVEVISGYLKIEKAGANYRARCPFHNEKTPSFFISPTRQTYHCFGCGKGGDLISFVQEMEGLEFMDALQILADQAGVKIAAVGQGANKENEKLSQILELATGYFEKELANNQSARDYLVSRGLTPDTIKSWRLGFAPKAWQGVSSFLKTRGYKDDQIAKVGLSIQGKPTPDFPGGRFYDRFRSRIMFPIADSRGRIVGFSGRIFGGTSEEEKEAKYINSPATTIYDKSRILYGFDRAKVEIRKTGLAILVEGQMDLVLSHQTGFTGTIATSGTALTKEHIESIKRLAGKMVMAFDADPAGIQASRRAVELALEAGLEVNIAKLPSGSDPADLILSSPAKWQEAIVGAKHIIDFYLEVLADRHEDSRQLGRAIREQIYPYISHLSYHIDQAHFIAKIANLLNLSENVIWDDYRQVYGSTGSTTSQPARQSPEMTEVKSRLSKIEEKLFGIIFVLTDSKCDSHKIDDIKKDLAQAYGETVWQDKTKFYEQSRSELAMQIEVLYPEPDLENLIKEARNLIGEAKLELLKSELNQAQLLLKKAEAQGQDSEVDKLIKKCQNITQAINQLKL